MKIINGFSFEKTKKMLERPVLLVEDDPVDFRIVQQAFEKFKHGIRLFRVSNGDQAIAYLKGEGPYKDRGMYPVPVLVLLDLRLPRRSGFEVLQWLRSRPESIRRLPVVVLSGSQEPTEINRAYEFGANSYLCKPSGRNEVQRLAEQFEAYWIKLNEFPDVQN